MPIEPSSTLILVSRTMKAIPASSSRALTKDRSTGSFERNSSFMASRCLCCRPNSLSRLDLRRRPPTLSPGLSPSGPEGDHTLGSCRQTFRLAGPECEPCAARRACRGGHDPCQPYHPRPRPFPVSYTHL